MTWETQQLDYPLLEDSLPPYEPRGMSAWYFVLVVPVQPAADQVPPSFESALLDAFREKKRQTGDPMLAWKALQADSSARQAYQQARGKGGFRRATWDEAQEIMAVANISTAEEYGPDRVIGFSPIPAMSMLSYAAGGTVPPALWWYQPQFLRLVLATSQLLSPKSGENRPMSARVRIGTTPR